MASLHAPPAVPAYASHLTGEEEDKVAALEAAVAPLAQSTPALRAFCTQATYLRYLRARSWNVAKAAKMLSETLRWRAEYRPEAIQFDDIKHEGARGKLFVLAQRDNEGRPVVLMRPRNEEVFSGDPNERIRWLVYTLEAACRLADSGAQGDGKMAWLIDFVGYSRKNSPPLRVSMQTLHILQNHYPERLGRAVCWHPPLLFDLLYRAVGPFVDPLTRDKLVFLNASAPPDALARHFDLAHIDESLGGQVPISKLFDLEQYGQWMRVLDTEAASSIEAAAAPTDSGAGAGAGAGAASSKAAAAGGQAAVHVRAAGSRRASQDSHYSTASEGAAELQHEPIAVRVAQ